MPLNDPLGTGEDASAAPPVLGSADSCSSRNARTAARPLMLVGTFHKTGTVLMLTVMRAVAERYGYRFGMATPDAVTTAMQICLHPHSHFPQEVLAVPHRGVVIIRDPRDVIISGMHYHCRDNARRDPWIYVPNTRFGGRSYHEAISSQPNEEERLLFEMANHGKQTLDDMKRWVSPPAGFILARLEDLSTDREMKEFRRIFAWLGLPEDQIPGALEIAEGKSLFSGKPKSEHIRSGRPEQWRQHFTPRVLEEFHHRFGDLPERLGYPAA